MRLQYKIAILLTCHNRVDTTLLGLRALTDGIKSTPRLEADIFLVDDGSTDGTTEQVSQNFPEIHIIQGDGTLFWNRGMCHAYRQARIHAKKYDAYLLYNDDVHILREKFPNFMDEFVALNKIAPSILAAAMKSPISDDVTYSGFRRTSSFRPAAVERVDPNSQVQPCDTFNGNLVVIPATFFDKIGGMDPVYRHAYGDIDLGLTAQRHAVGVYLASGVVGACTANTPIVARLRGEKFGRRWKILFGYSNSINDYIHFVRKNGPRFLWPSLVAYNICTRLFQLLTARNH